MEIQAILKLLEDIEIGKNSQKQQIWQKMKKMAKIEYFQKMAKNVKKTFKIDKFQKIDPLLSVEKS